VRTNAVVLVADLQRGRLKVGITHDEQKHFESCNEGSPKTEVPDPTGRELLFRFEMWILRSKEKKEVGQSN
jgi:hypothetical protein